MARMHDAVTHRVGDLHKLSKTKTMMMRRPLGDARHDINPNRSQIKGDLAGNQLAKLTQENHTLCSSQSLGAIGEPLPTASEIILLKKASARSPARSTSTRPNAASTGSTSQSSPHQAPPGSGDSKVDTPKTLGWPRDANHKA
jgi:hypothetical protein